MDRETDPKSLSFFNFLLSNRIVGSSGEHRHTDAQPQAHTNAYINAQARARTHKQTPTEANSGYGAELASAASERSD